MPKFLDSTGLNQLITLIKSNFKAKLTAITTDPASDGSGITFVDSVKLDAQGVVTIHRKSVLGASASQAGLMSSTDFLKLLGIESGAQKHIAPTADEIKSALGATNGVATLGSDGKVPSNQLPGFVDDVIEGYYNNNHFYKEAAHTNIVTDETGVSTDQKSGKIYVDLATNKTYRWGTSQYAEISSSDVTGIKIGESGATINPSSGIITLPSYESGAQVNTITGVKGNSENTYRTGNVNITAANIGLGNVGNFKAVSTVASQELSSTEQANARANIGAGTSSFSGSYTDLSNKPTIPTVNNGTFSVNTKVGSAPAVTVADFTANQSGTDDVTIIQGTNVTLTTDTTSRTITISATDTTYDALTVDEVNTLWNAQ